MDNDTKKNLIKKHSPHSAVVKNSLRAFLVGGALCSLAEIIFHLYSSFVEEKTASTLVTLTFILIAAILTGIGVFDTVARFAGAGTLVPVTGFSNAVVSEAMDAKSEGIILGVGSKIFNVSGPVILFGISAGFLYGVIYYFYLLISGA